MLDRKQRSLEAWKQIAINEAAMAVVAVNFPDLKNIEFVWSLLYLFHYFDYAYSHTVFCIICKDLREAYF